MGAAGDAGAAKAERPKRKTGGRKAAPAESRAPATAVEAEGHHKKGRADRQTAKTHDVSTKSASKKKKASKKKAPTSDVAPPGKSESVPSADATPLVVEAADRAGLSSSAAIPEADDVDFWLSGMGEPMNDPSSTL